MAKQFIIYIPGIKDDLHHAQSIFLRFWQLFGVKACLHEMPWFGPDPYEPKMQKLLDLIDKYSANNEVSLIGASAGASAAINAYMERRDKIHKVVLICGKINFPTTVYERTYKRNPAFKTSMQELQINLAKINDADKAKMHSFYSPADTVVPYKDSKIEGITESQLPNLRHGRAIIYSLTFGARRIIKVIRH